MRLQETNTGTILEVYVKPNAKEFRIDIDGDELVVSCRAIPAKGKVNKELLKQFSRIFNKNVELVSGFTSRQKKFLVYDVEAQEINKILVSICCHE